MSNRRRVELRSDALVAARRFAAALVANGEDMSSAERVVVTRALHHQLVLAFRELGIIDLSRVTEDLRPSDTQDPPVGDAGAVPLMVASAAAEELADLSEGLID